MKVSVTFIGIAASTVAFVAIVIFTNGAMYPKIHPIAAMNQTSQAAESKVNPVAVLDHNATVALKPNATASQRAVVDESQFAIAPRFQGIGGYINTGPLNIEDLRGKVVLVDFWTVDCINCTHTMPYVVGWNSKYSDKGLVVVGVHTPEFEFEKDEATVQSAVKDFGIQFPVLLDNNYQTWNAYDNHYWPHMYLVDSSGHIRYDHIGEGAYDTTESMIQTLLAEREMASG